MTPLPARPGPSGISDSHWFLRFVPQTTETSMGHLGFRCTSRPSANPTSDVSTKSGASSRVEIRRSRMMLAARRVVAIASRVARVVQRAISNAIGAV